MDKFIPAVPKKGQEEYAKAMQEHSITICVGKAGIGKTFLALNAALQHLFNDKSKINKIVVVKPYMPSITGEKIGALPGDLEEKICPYIQGIRDNLKELLSTEKQLQDVWKKIEFTTLSFLRGRSLNNAFIIVDEAQNVPYYGEALKMVLTRIGKNSKLVLQGDLDQMDIRTEDSDLIRVMNILTDIDDIAIIELSNDMPSYRNPLIDKILKAYERYNKNG